MKIGIATIIDNNNYGNRLQNLALTFFLSKYGDVKTIRNSPNDDYNFPKNYIKGFLYRLYIFKRILKRELTLKRINNFRLFNDQIKFASKKESFKFDFFVAGSDQIWNPYHNRLSNMDVLRGYDKNKCISYAASFGVNELKETKHRNIIEEEVCCFKSLSVRENEGKRIICDLCNRSDVEVLIDPTMLLTSDEWDCFSKKPKNLTSKKYILNYFLGELSYDRREEIARIAMENDCDIINILDKNDSMFSSGPAEFLYLEKHAFLVCTDSFHSSVFAILYNKPFIVFDREQKGVKSMNSRINTLLTKFNIVDRWYNGKEITKDNLKHDYTEAYKILNDERRKSREFLKKGLDIKDSD